MYISSLKVTESRIAVTDRYIGLRCLNFTHDKDIVAYNPQTILKNRAVLDIKSDAADQQTVKGSCRSWF